MKGIRLGRKAGTDAATPGDKGIFRLLRLNVSELGFLDLYEKESI